MIPVLALLDAPSAALLAAALAALAAALFAGAAGAKLRTPVGVGLGLLGLTLRQREPAHPAATPRVGEGHARRRRVLRFDTLEQLLARHHRKGGHGSALFLGERQEHARRRCSRRVEQRQLMIDGVAGTVMVELGAGLGAHDYLDYEMTAAVHELRPHGAAAVIGVGGGRDVLAAARAGHEPVVGIELNGLIVDAHTRVHAQLLGHRRYARRDAGPG